MTGGVGLVGLGTAAGLGPLWYVNDPSPGMYGLCLGMLLIGWSFGVAAVLMGYGSQPRRPPVAD